MDFRTGCPWALCVAFFTALFRKDMVGLCLMGASHPSLLTCVQPEHSGDIAALLLGAQD